LTRPGSATNNCWRCSGRASTRPRATSQFCDSRIALPHGHLCGGPTSSCKPRKASLAALEKSKPFKEPIVTQIEGVPAFYPAEDYHQDYYKKNPVRYKYYRTSCGRDERLQQLWGPKRP
jgi:peptide-methionine (S)-S-oxide reductase